MRELPHRHYNKASTMSPRWPRLCSKTLDSISKCNTQQSGRLWKGVWTGRTIFIETLYCRTPSLEPYQITRHPTLSGTACPPIQSAWARLNSCGSGHCNVMPPSLV